MNSDYKNVTDEDFVRDFDAMSAIGATAGGGVERQAATDEDNRVREWFTSLLADLKIEARYDQAGNQFGTLEFVPGAPYVLLGSHLDSQPLAGRFDGAYGVLAAAYAAGRVRDSVDAGEISPRHNIAVVNWFNEEGSRFSPSMMGSSVATGKLDLDKALQSRDLAGITVAEAFDRLDWDRSAHLPTVSAYAEIHNEQGKILEREGKQIGVVTATWGAKKYHVTVTGEQGHTGSTLMADRQDALFGAAVVIAEIRRLTAEFGPGELQASVSQMQVLPNSPVTIARHVEFNVDLRSPIQDVLDRAAVRVQKIFRSAENEAHVGITSKLAHDWGLNPYPVEGVRLAREVADAENLTHMDIYTVAGHDSTNYKDVVPTVMLFVPSVDGISHNEKEFTSKEDCLTGLRMLTGVARRLVKE